MSDAGLCELPRPRNPKFIGQCSAAWSILPVLNGPPESIPTVMGPSEPPIMVVMPDAMACSTSWALSKCTCTSMAPAVHAGGRASVRKAKSPPSADERSGHKPVMDPSRLPNRQPPFSCGTSRLPPEPAVHRTRDCRRKSAMERRRLKLQAAQYKIGSHCEARASARLDFDQEGRHSL